MDRFEKANDELERRICQDENVSLISNTVNFIK